MLKSYILLYVFSHFFSLGKRIRKIRLCLCSGKAQCVFARPETDNVGGRAGKDVRLVFWKLADIVQPLWRLSVWQGPRLTLLKRSVLPVLPKYRLGHPGHYLFLLSKIKLIGSKQPQKKRFWRKLHCKGCVSLSRNLRKHVPYNRLLLKRLKHKLEFVEELEALNEQLVVGSKLCKICRGSVDSKHHCRCFLSSWDLPSVSYIFKCWWFNMCEIQ